MLLETIKISVIFFLAVLFLAVILPGSNNLLGLQVTRQIKLKSNDQTELKHQKYQQHGLMNYSTIKINT